MRKHLSVAAAIAGVAVIAACSSSTKGAPSNPSTAPGGSTASTGSSTSGGSSAASNPSGGSSISEADLRKRVEQAMTAATSFHMVGSGGDDNGKPIRFDVHFGQHQVAGSIVEGGVKIELINPGGASVYFKAPDSMWQQQGGAAAVSMFHGKWVKVPANDKQFTELTGSFDKDAFIRQMMSDDSGSSPSDLKKVGAATVNGAPAIRYRSESDHTDLYVAANGAPVILKIVDGSKSGGTLTFSDYGKAYPVTPPPASQTIDFTKLANGGN